MPNDPQERFPDGAPESLADTVREYRKILASGNPLGLYLTDDLTLISYKDIPEDALVAPNPFGYPNVLLKRIAIHR